MLVYMLLGLLILVCVTNGEKLKKSLDTGYGKYKETWLDEGEDAESRKAYTAFVIAGLMFAYMVAWPVMVVFFIAKAFYKPNDTDKGTPA